MGKTAVHMNLLQAFRQSKKGYVEFERDGHPHSAIIEGVLFQKDGSVIIAAPDVCVDYGKGRYIPMSENDPRHHHFDWSTAKYQADGHYVVDSAGIALSIYLFGEDPE